VPENSDAIPSTCVDVEEQKSFLFSSLIESFSFDRMDEIFLRMEAALRG